MLVCDLTGTLLQLDGNPHAFATIRARPQRLAGSGGQIHLTGVSVSLDLCARTDRNGIFTLRLPQSLPVWIYLPGDDTPRELVVPSLESADLFDHLFVRLVSVDWAQLVDADGTWEIQNLDTVMVGIQLTANANAGDIVRVCLRATFSNGQQSAFTLDHVTTDPVMQQVDGQDAWEVTLDAPGEVQVSRTSSDQSVDADPGSWDLILLTQQEHSVALPGDLVVLFA